MMMSPSGYAGLAFQQQVEVDVLPETAMPQSSGRP
jgi:hypothetical protein